MFRRRKHPSKWSHDRWRQQMRACFTTDPDAAEVKASVIVHWDLNLMPRDTIEEAKRDVEEAGEEWDGFREYAVFLLAFDDDDRPDLFMDGNMSVLVRSMLQERTLDDAKATAREWVGQDGLELPFENIPGIYQAAFYEWVTGEEWDRGPAMFMWALPAIGDNVPVRQFPPPVDQ